mgnify:CR=1
MKAGLFYYHPIVTGIIIASLCVLSIRGYLKLIKVASRPNTQQSKP